MDQKQKLISWLQDAHAIELSVEKILTRHARAAKDFPELAGQLEKHAAQSHRHADKIDGCLRGVGGSFSPVEAAVGKLLGTMEAMATGLVGDPVVTNTAADYAVEHLEISTYSAIVAAAEAAGQRAIGDECRAIILEEQEMARWLREYIPVLTLRYLGAAGA